MKRYKAVGAKSRYNDAYSELATAIIGQACADYINYHLQTQRPKSYWEITKKDDLAEIRKKRNRKERMTAIERNYESAVRFLNDNNSWFTMLSSVSADYLIKTMDKIIVEMKNDNKKVTKWTWKG